MKTAQDYSIEERRLMLLRYLEGLLPETEMRMVEQFLESNEEASREFDELRDIFRIMRKDHRAFCPEPWLISEFLETGEDPSGELSKHLRECSACREETVALGEPTKHGSMPRQLLENIMKELGVPTKERPLVQDEGLLSLLQERLATFFRFRVAAMAAVAAAVLLVVFLYPGPSVGPVIALSSVTWDGGESDLGGGLLGVVPKGKERVTIILRFKGAEKPLSQETIDSLYKALTPRGKLVDEYEFVPPAMVKEVVAAELSSAGDLNGMLHLLRTMLAIEKAAIMTTAFDGSRALVRGELIETATGNRVGKDIQEAFDRTELESKIGAIAYAVLATVEKREKKR
jgi:hypothetical protein